MKVARFKFNLYFKFRYEVIRLLSLLRATMDSPSLWGGVNPPVQLARCKEMAKDGFFFVGPEDRVRCAFCRLEITHWSSTDVVHEEHIKFNAACPFLSGGGTGLGSVSIGDEALANLGHDANPFFGNFSIKAGLIFSKFLKILDCLK